MHLILPLLLLQLLLLVIVYTILYFTYVLTYDIQLGNYYTRPCVCLCVLLSTLQYLRLRYMIFLHYYKWINNIKRVKVEKDREKKRS